jgi:thiol-disulfide isomerase/thioredoxin
VSAGVWVVVGVLVAATAFGVYRRLTDGRIRGVDERQRPPGGGSAVDDPHLVSAQDIGEPLGDRATLLQFSTAFCQPCRPTRRVLADVAGMVDGVRHVDVDAESHLDLVRRLGVVRTPTVLVLDGAGRVVRRASGVPRRADVVAALGEAIP